MILRLVNEFVFMFIVYREQISHFVLLFFIIDFKH